MLDIDYNQLQDKFVNAALMPINYVYDIGLYYNLLYIFLVLVVYGIILPMIAYIVRWIKAICHPITFPYKHVLITGCGTGLGKALVQEIYMKGAYITMIGRDAEKLQRVA